MFEGLDPRSPIPLYAQIASRIRLAVATGAVVPETRLPSVRFLASQLRVNPATVVRAYTELENAGIVETRGTTGVFAKPLSDSRQRAERRREARRLVAELLQSASSSGVTMHELDSAWHGVLKRPLDRRAPGEVDAEA